jgi:hypothetical protein
VQRIEETRVLVFVDVEYVDERLQGPISWVVC